MPLPYQRLADDADAKTRHRKWRRYVHRRPDEDESLAIARSIASGLPYGSASWIKALSRKLKLDLTIRPRGRPRKQPTEAKGTQRACNALQEKKVLTPFSFLYDNSEEGQANGKDTNNSIVSGSCFVSFVRVRGGTLGNR